MISKDQRIHIAIFGRRNYGKSSFINAIGGQDIAIVSDVAGTTTDPVKKTIEIHGLGPAVMIDTAGIDDSGELGEKRVEKSFAVINQIDIAILMLCDNTFDDVERYVIRRLTDNKVNFIVIYNKVDIALPDKTFVEKVEKEIGDKILMFSSKEPDIQLVVDKLVDKLPDTVYNDNDLFRGVVGKGELVVLVTPIDSAAPEGRMILPQVQSIRNVLDHDAINVVCKETDLSRVLNEYKIKPALVVTASQAFKYVASIVPEDIPLTGFSLVLARLKGNYTKYLEGTPQISKLKDGDKILILESCAHHPTCEDIGRVKLPALLSKFTSKELSFTVLSGFTPLPGNITDYAMVIQCGGCVFTRKQLESRLRPVINAGIPVSNYGMTIAYVTGIFDRAVKGLQQRVF
ncbi:MAG: [FeFe] hydrogenase H-cluster maturation GTPase HydF [Bacteroidales bacterium]|nr:[FeFe] hydrogenase H-cluster maturation GTPase HydF [Bacteroidales bacterium]